MYVYVYVHIGLRREMVPR